MEIPDKYMHTLFQLNIITDEMLEMMLNNTFPEEVWNVIDYPGIVTDRYEISSYGRIRIFGDDYIVKQHLNHKGYYVYTYPSQDKRQKTVATHRIVAVHFVPGRTEERNQVNHKDTFKINNYYQNLEWVTSKENNKHAIENGLIKYVRGDTHGKSIITDEEAIEICKLINMHQGNDDKVYEDIILINPNIPRRIIQEIRRKEIRTHISDEYLKENYYRRNISEEDKQLIISTLIKNDMSQSKVLRELPQFSYNTIRDIKRRQIGTKK